MRRDEYHFYMKTIGVEKIATYICQRKEKNPLLIATFRIHFYQLLSWLFPCRISILLSETVFSKINDIINRLTYEWICWIIKCFLTNIIFPCSDILIIEFSTYKMLNTKHIQINICESLWGMDSCIQCI